MDESLVDIQTLIITNYTDYLDQCVNSAINPLVVFDGIPIPTDFNYHAVACNASRPSVARNLGLSKIIANDFIQLLDSDDFLNENYFDTVLPILSQNPDFDIFFTDYNVLNEDFNFSNREFLRSIDEYFIIDNLFKIKNPIVRSSVFKNKQFDQDLTHFEIIDFLLRNGIDKIFHIPQPLQTIRIHPKGYNRISNRESQKRSLNIINGRIHGKV